jgi:hypothetical protein
MAMREWQRFLAAESRAIARKLGVFRPALAPLCARASALSCTPHVALHRVRSSAACFLHCNAVRDQGGVDVGLQA